MRYVIALVILLAVLLTVQPIWSQEARGTILGRITDSSGAVVPGATVRLTHVETKTVRNTTTNEQGNYTAPLLPSGMYEIVVEKQGFKRFVRGGIELRLTDNLEVNMALEVGAQTESVTVTGESPLLETASASMGQVVDARRMTELPLALGNAMDMIRQAASTYVTGSYSLDQPWEPSGGTGYTFAGSSRGAVGVTMDGANNTAQDGASMPTRNVAAFNPPPDSVAEMKVQTISFDGTTGSSEGGVVNVSLKSGTNTLHGSYYYAGIATALTANTWFANRNNIARPDAHMQRWGGSANGPVWIPGVYNGKNKTFFMFSMENQRFASLRASNNTVPTAAQRAGDLSDLLAINSSYQIYNPFTRRSIGGGRYQEDPIVGNLIASVKPVDPIATKLMNPINYLLPTTAGTSADGANNYPRPDATQQVFYNVMVGRIDHNFSDKHRFFMRADRTHTTIEDPVLWGPQSIYSTTFFWNMGRGFAMDDVYIFSPTFVMNLKLSDAAWIRASDSNPAGIVDLKAAYGFSDFYNNLWQVDHRRTPGVSIEGYTGFTGASQSKNWSPQESRSASGSFDKTWGSHSFKWGFEYRQGRKNNYSIGVGTVGGNLSYSSAYTKGPLDNSTASNRGQGLADFLLGLPTSASGTSADSWSDMSTYYGGFFQDDVKITRKLTMSVSLRYEIEGPVTERYDRTVRDFNPTIAHTSFNGKNFDALAAAAYALNPVTERPVSTWSTLGGIEYAGVNGVPRTLLNYDKNRWMPRIGLAYSLDKNTVIRGGYGVYYSQNGYMATDPNSVNYNQTTNGTLTLDNGLTFLTSTYNPLPQGLLQPYRNSLAGNTSLGGGASFFSPIQKASHTQKFQVNIQRQLPGRIVFDISYIGSRTGGFPTSRSYNAFPSKYLSTLPTRDQAVIDYWSASVPNPFAGLVPEQSGRNGSTISRQSLILDYPQFSGLSGKGGNEGWTKYNGMMVQVQRRFSQGFTVSYSWTWARNFAATGFMHNEDLYPTKALANDYPHHMQANFIYELPFGKGRPLLTRINRIGDSVIGGWQVGGTWILQSGNALSVGDVIYTGSNLKDIVLSRDVRNTNKWFDTTNFNKVSSQQLSMHYRTIGGPWGWFRGSRLNQCDLSVLKNIKITERVAGQFRAEAINAFNQVWFNNPDTSPTSSTFGQVTGEQEQPRKIQLELRVTF
jgi:hypothetical protein